MLHCKVIGLLWRFIYAYSFSIFHYASHIMCSPCNYIFLPLFIFTYTFFLTVLTTFSQGRYLTNKHTRTIAIRSWQAFMKGYQQGSPQSVHSCILTFSLTQDKQMDIDNALYRARIGSHYSCTCSKYNPKYRNYTLLLSCTLSLSLITWLYLMLMLSGDVELNPVNKLAELYMQ